MRVTLSWHLGPDFKFNPDLAKASDVAIRFKSEGPSATLVELEHSGIERHGEGYEQLRAMLDGPDAWVTTLEEFAKAADREVTAMKTTLFLRIASVLTLIHAVLHTIGGVFGKRRQTCSRW